MPRWAPLPSNLEPAIRQLVVSLREVKDQLGLGTAALGRRTGYSKSSWDRYLNGRALPQQEAVAALARLAGIDPERLLAEQEMAAAAWAQRPGQAGEHPATDAIDAPPGSRRRWGVGVRVGVAASVVAMLAVGLGVWLVLSGGDGGQTPPLAPAAARPTHPGCAFTRTDGRLYAGHSSTADRIVGVDQRGEDVVELQCLLEHHGFDPGGIDGIFGERTEAAVRAIQRAARPAVVVDGIVGPQTWALLRA